MFKLNLNFQMDKKAKPMKSGFKLDLQQQPPAQAKTKTKKQKLPITYQEYMVKEQTQKTSKNTNQSVLNQSENRSLKKENGKILKKKPANARKSSNSASQTRRTTSHEMKKEIQVVFNNFMQRLEDGDVQDDDSLLQESNQEPDRESKQMIVHEHQLRREQERMVSREKAIRDEHHRLEALAALDQRVKSQVKEFQRQKAAQKRQKELVDRRKQKKIDQIVKFHQGSHATTEVMRNQPADVVSYKSPAMTLSAGQQQLSELRAWIEQQMRSENMFSQLSKETDEPQLKRKDDSLTAFDNSAPKLVSIQVVSPKKDAKKGDQQQPKSRDRSKISQKSDKSEKSQKKTKPVEATKKPISTQKPKKSEHPLKKAELPGNRLLSDEEQSKLPNARKNRYGVFPPSDGNTDFDKAVTNQRSKMQPAKLKSVSNDLHSLIQEEVSETTEKNLSDDSCDQVPVRQQSNQPYLSQRREILNKPANVKEAPILPGVTNIKQQAEEDARRRREREIKAAVIIQKFYRGYIGRLQAVKQRNKISRQIEEEYGRFERDIKRSREYDLKRYLQDKKKIREKTGLKPHESMQSIAEMIGDSSSAKAKQSTIFDALFKQNAKIDKDPLSLISVFAKNHQRLPAQSQTRTNQKEKRKLAQKKYRTQTTSESIIEEDYPNDFEESVPKESSTIEEDLPSSKSSSKPISALKSKGLVPAVGAVSQANKKVQPKKRTVKESPAESIADEIIDEVPDSIKEDSIIEESGLSDSKQSIIRDEYDNNDAKIAEAKQKIEARNRIRFGFATEKTDERPKEQVHKETILLDMGEKREQIALQRQRVLGDLLGELKEYEKAHISSTAIERMEKIVVASLAQKDQIIMAQLLAEKEREKRHSEEIARIREEQIKMMTQMMLLGLGQGAQVLSDTQRQEAIDNVKKLVEKPITIKQETVHVNYSIQKVEAPIDRSLHDELKDSQKPKKKTYLEEFDESRSKNDIAQRSNDFSSSKKRGPTEEDEIADEVQDSEQQSIAEEIDQSRQSSQSASQSQSTLFRNNSFQEFKQERLKKATKDGHDMHQILSQIELAIIQEKEQRESDLKQRLKKRKLTNKSYEQKVRELEKWVSTERKDVLDRKSKADYDYRNVKMLIKDINSDRQVLSEKIGVSPKRQRQTTLQSDQLEEDSHDSEGTRQAIRQSQKLKSGQLADPEAKYLEKKRQIATSLMEEKEKAIQQGLKNRLIVYEEENTDDLMKKALNIDVKAEINRRFEIAKKIIEDSGSLQDSTPSNIEKVGKAQKVVKFAPGLKESEAKIQITEDSMAESIHAESVSNSVKSNLVERQLRQGQTSSLGGLDRSEASSEYSEDFAESTEKESSSKNQKLQTMVKLQNKAKDLEESNAYSDKFEEESIGQSQPQRIELGASANKMDSVKEESIDESIEVTSKTSKPDQSHEKSVIESLPSVDIEVKDSGKSTDWQIQVTQDHHLSKSSESLVDEYRDKQSQIEEEISDLNNREEIDDLQSCPDDIGKSQTDLLIQKADAIADELLKALIDGYKNEPKFALTAKVNQPDEDEFRDKFPWTLERVPEKPKEPEIIKRPETPKKVKSDREIADEKFKAQHQAQLEKLEERHTEVSKYLDFLCKRTDLQKLIEALNEPIKKDPLKMLKQIQAYEEDESSVIQNDSNQKANSQQILSYQFFCKVDREFMIMQRMQKLKLTNQQAEDSDMLSVSQEDKENILNIHHYALFEALNDALDQERPYRAKGQPMPWSSNSRTFKRISTPDQARKILEQASQKVLLIERTSAGTNLAPLPVAPAQTQDDDGNEVIPPPLAQGEEERRNMNRHQKLAQLMTEDIQENELQWVDYEVQDTQARFDLADMILHQLTGEIVSILEARHE